MKRLLIAMPLVALCATSLVLAETPATQPAAPQPAATQPDIFKTQMDKVSYVIGAGLGTNAKRSEVDLNTDMIMQGFKDAFAGESKLTEDQMREIMMAFSQDLQAKMAEKQAKQGETNKKAGEEFLAKNAKEEGVVTLPSGLQYKVIKEGTGATPKPTDTVDVKYRGTLIDGTEFDTSGDTTRAFPVAGVVKGFSEALQKMPVGSEWKVFIPSDLAYGVNAPPSIGPNATLIFNVTLTAIQEVKASAAPAPQRHSAATQPSAH